MRPKSVSRETWALAYYKATHAATRLWYGQTFMQMNFRRSERRGTLTEYRSSRLRLKFAIIQGRVKSMNDPLVRNYLIISTAGELVWHAMMGKDFSHVLRKEHIINLLEEFKLSEVVYDEYHEKIIQEIETLLNNADGSSSPLWLYIETIATLLIKRDRLSFKECEFVYNHLGIINIDRVFFLKEEAA